MGNFGGHALPGAFLIIYGIWWTIWASIRKAKSNKQGVKFLSTVTYGCSGCGRLDRYPLEPIVKIVLVAIAFTLEIYTGTRDGKFKIMGNAQHATMFFYFFFGGIVEIMMLFKIPLPPNTDYIVLTMSFMVEALLFKFHPHGVSQLEFLLHTLLLYTIYACIISVVVEIKYRHTIVSPLTRAYFVLLQGTWFWQLAFILYNPVPGAVAWKADDHDEMTLATLYFAWHALVDFIIIIVVTTTIQTCYARRGTNVIKEPSAYQRLLHYGRNGDAVISLQDDSASDLECEQPVSPNQADTCLD